MADIHKLADEQFMISGNFTNVLRGDILDPDACLVYAEDRNGAVVTSTVIDVSTLIVVGGVLRVRVRGGTFALSPYHIKLIAETLGGNRWIIPVVMHIDEE